INQLSDSVNSKITSVEQKFDELEIGGRNLAKGTSDKLIKSEMNSWNLYHDSVLTPDTEVIPGEKYTASVYYHDVKDIDMTIRLFWTLKDGSRLESSNGSYIVVGESGYATITRTAPDEAVAVKHVIRRNRGTDAGITHVEYKEVKLEKGNKATDWTPAPEDYQTQIDNQDKVLTKHETEIEQNKLGLNTKVSYTEMNGTNKTLEKLLTEFSQTADGFNFRIDSNGMIQDLTFDRNGFKLNSNLIEFNDGDVIIKDGVTTIKDAYIDKLFSKTAFVEQLKAVDIDLNRATITGGDSTNNIKLDHQSIMSYGIFTRSWGGET